MAPTEPGSGLMKMFVTAKVVASEHLHSPSGRVERQRGEGDRAEPPLLIWLPSPRFGGRAAFKSWYYRGL